MHDHCRGPPNFLHLCRVEILCSSLPCHLKQWCKQDWVELWWLLNKCGKNMIWRLQKGWLTSLTHRKQQCWPIPKASSYLSKTQQLESGTSITPWSPLRRIDLTNKTDQNWPNPGSTNHVRVHAAHDREHGCQYSLTLYRGCTHSSWVMIILASRVPIVHMSTLTHFWGVR
jgi:hypothetical protein